MTRRNLAAGLAWITLSILCWAPLFSVAKRTLPYLDPFALGTVRYLFGVALFVALLVAVEGRKALRYDGRLGGAALFGLIGITGFNVYPNEIEQVVAMHPGVLEVAAIGVPDEHSGEVPKVFVVKKDPQLTEADVLEHCKKELTGYKRPKYVEFRADLPKTNVGKILRRALRDEKKAA